MEHACGAGKGGCREGGQGFHSLALFIQQVEKRGGFLADQVDAGAVVYVVDVVPGDALCSVLLLCTHTHKHTHKGHWFKP